MEDDLNAENAAESAEIIDLEEFAQADKKPPAGRKYRVRVDEALIIFNHEMVTGAELLQAAGRVPPECFALYQLLKGHDFEKIGLNDQLDLSRKGIERFVVKPPEVFNYFVDDEPETTDDKELTPDQILELAGITPASDYYLVQINPDGSQISHKDDPATPIKMRCPAMRFVSVFRGETPVS